MARFRFTGLRLRLLVLVVITMLPALAMILYGGWQNREAARAQEQEDALQMALLAADRHDDLIERAFSLAETLGSLPQVQGDDKATCEEVLVNLLAQNESFSGIFIVHPEGSVICSAPPANSPINVADRDYFSQAMEGRQPMMGPFLVGRITGVPTLPSIYPVLDNQGEVLRLVVIGLDLRWLESFNNEQVDETNTLLVFNEDRTILSRHPGGGNLIGQEGDAPIIQHILNNPGPGTTEAAGLDGVLKLYGYAPLSQRPENRAYVAIGIPLTVVDNPVNRALALNLSAILLILLGGSASLLLSEMTISRRVDRLIRVAESLASGDLTARTGVSRVRGELDHLAQQLDEMAGSLQQQVAQRREAERSLRRLARQLATAQEEERRALAAELHDSAGQWITALRINLQVFLRTLPPEMEEQRAQVAGMEEMTDILGEDLRRLAHRLRPPALDRLGLHAALEKLCDDFARHAHLSLVYEGSELPPVPNSTSTACYRFVQEALNNAAKHAQANQIKLSLEHDQEQFTLVVQDDGVGFRADQGLGLGLVGMQERIEGVGGTLVIKSDPGRGTRLVATVPL